MAKRGAGARRGKRIEVSAWNREKIAAYVRRPEGVDWDQLTRKSGMERTTIGRIANGKIRSTPHLDDLLEAIGASPDEAGAEEPGEAQLVEAYRRMREADAGTARSFVEEAEKWANEAVLAKRDQESAAVRLARLAERRLPAPSVGQAPPHPQPPRPARAPKPPAKRS